jgi:hypothetical protein
MRADPRACNTGVTPTPPLGRVAAPAGALEARFDWYSATADGLDDGRVAPALALSTGARVLPGRGWQGYAHGEVVQRGDDVLAKVWGGSARPGEVHVQVSGWACDEVVPVMRRLWPAHRVARADSALDFAGDFDVLDAQLVEFAAARGIRHELHANSEGGATRYLGARSSEVRLRLYKKSEEQREKYPELAHEIPGGVVRAELEVRPGKRALKEAGAVMAPDDFWGMSRWAGEYAQQVLGLDPIRTSTHFRRPSDWARAGHFLATQYGPAVNARAADIGRDAAAAEVLALLGLDL